ncbi:MAG: signal recognition particle-docking protein FtsY [Hyphomicrobiaceae bacterium]|nr:signal recognition particle-docking protein FtsY [Hyphomicrobiaceae bacterium]
MSGEQEGSKKRGLFGRWFGGGDSKTDAAPQPPAEPAGAPPVEHTEPPTEAPQRVSEQSPAPPVLVETPPAEPAPKQGWFQRLTSGLSKTSAKLSEGIASVFTKRKLDAATLDDLEDVLIQADLGVDTAMRITERISSGRFEKGISVDDVRAILASEVEQVLIPVAKPLIVDGSRKPHVLLMVGVNGTGKTTTIGKLAARFRREGKSVLMAAGDTFRAAAIDQLKVWGERTGATVLARDVGADSAGLAFDALTQAQSEGYDVVMIDTAGRLQNKAELMAELEKVIRVIRKVEPDAPHDVLLVLDATTGQNALSQVEVFREKAGVTGLVMTKLDGTARGGILVAIAAKYGLPVHAIGVGEGVDDLSAFDPKEFAQAIAMS